MPSRAEIIRQTSAEARLQLFNLVDLYERQMARVFEALSELVNRTIARAEKEGKIPPGSFTKIQNDMLNAVNLPKFAKGDVMGVVGPGLYKDLNATVLRGISAGADAALKTAILTMDAAGIARKAIQIGTSFIGPDGQVRRFNAAKETFLKSTWHKANSRVVNAVKAWKPGGIAFSPRVWNITYETQKGLLNIVQTGIVQGKSAASLSRDVRSFLVQPETLRGKQLKDYHPGRGVYRSAYKNALRMTATEINRAHSQAMLQYVKSKNFLDGVIWRRGSIGPCATGECPANADKFFTVDDFPELPAHAWCRCYAEPHIQGDPVEKNPSGPGPQE